MFLKENFSDFYFRLSHRFNFLNIYFNTFQKRHFSAFHLFIWKTCPCFVYYLNTILNEVLLKLDYKWIKVLLHFFDGWFWKMSASRKPVALSEMQATIFELCVYKTDIVFVCLLTSMIKICVLFVRNIFVVHFCSMKYLVRFAFFYRPTFFTSMRKSKLKKVYIQLSIENHFPKMLDKLKRKWIYCNRYENFFVNID